MHSLPTQGLLSLAALSLCLLPLPARQTWKKEAARKGLSQQQLHLLQNQGFATGTLGGNPALFYRLTKHPIYTSDSLIRVYCHLLEQGMRRQAFVQHGRLSRCLEALWTNLKKKGHARGIPGFLVGGALSLLLGERPKGLPSELQAQLEPFLHMARTAKGKAFPPLWGPQDSRFMGLFFELFEPQGFYRETPGLGRLFRASRWLSSIPLRLDQASERRAALQLRKAYLSLPPSTRTGLRSPSELAGPPETWDLVFLSQLPKAKWPRAWKRHKRILRKRAIVLRGGAYIHILSPSKPPDTQYLERLGRKRRQLPRAAWLLPPLAAGKLGREDGSLHEHFLSLLQILLRPPAPRAPKIFRTRPRVQKKQKQTVLASWVQARSSLVLQTLPALPPLGKVSIGGAWVEPYPQFFKSLARLSLRASQTFQLPDQEWDGYLREEFVRVLDRILANLANNQENSPNLSYEQEELLSHWASVLTSVRQKKKPLQVAELEVLPPAPLPKDLKALKAWIQKLHGEFPRPLGPLGHNFFRSLRAGSDKHLSAAFHRLANLASRLNKLLEARLLLATKSPADPYDLPSLKEINNDFEALSAFQDIPWATGETASPISYRLAYDPRSSTSVIAHSERPRVLYILLPIGTETHLFSGVFLPFREESKKALE